MSGPDAPSSPRRRVATVLFTDIVGSTQRLAELGDAKWHSLLRRHDEIVRTAIEHYGGREVNTAGDSFLVVFENPAQAIECAVAAAEAVHGVGIQIRAGIHTGEIVETETDVRGIGVHIGARISAKAGAGEVLVSRTVRDLARGSDHQFEPRGTFVLKGVPGQWRLYAVAGTARRGGPLREARVWLDRHRRLAVAALVVMALGVGAVAVSVVIQGSGPGFSPERLLAADAPAAIAVLPFTVRGEGTEIWREGMVDILSTGLDGAAGLRTISSRTLLARWAQEVVDDEAADITKALEVAWGTGARYALAGSVVAAGPNMRLIAEAYDIDTGSRLGQAQVEGAPDEVLSLCDRLGVEMLAIILEKGEEEIPPIDLASVMSDTTAALQAYLEGEVHFRHLDVTAAEKAYKRAVEADSTFALAHYQLAKVYWWPELRNDPLINHHNRRAVQLADRLPARQALLARANHAWFLGDLDTAVEPLRQAVQVYPDDAEVWYQLAERLYHMPGVMATGEEVDHAFERAVELDPRNANYLYHYVGLAWNLHGDSALAAQRLEMYERVAPGHGLVRGGRLALDLAFGDSVAQREAMTQLRSEEGTQVAPTVISLLLHPRYAALQPVTRLLHERGNDAQRSLSATTLFNTNARWYGRLREALPYLDDPAISDTGRAYAAYRAFVVGLPIPEETLERALDPTLIDSVASITTVFRAGAFAADRGRWSDHGDAIAELQRRAERALGQADTGGSRGLTGGALALEGYGLWRQGQPAAALLKLEDPRAKGQPWRVVRLWLSQIYRERGRLRDAERVYRSYDLNSRFWNEPLARRQLGEVYEALEEWDKALESYEYFVEYWNDADPELQPMVEEARQAIIRLRGLRRE